MTLPFRNGLLVLSLLGALSACRDTKVVSYRIPKDKAALHDHASGSAMPEPAAGGSSMANLAVSSAEQGSLIWTAPASWKRTEGSAMRKGSYSVGPESGPAADLSITAFPGDVGGEVANVNRWRSQIGLSDLADAEVPGAITRLTSGDVPVSLVDLVNGEKRMLAAFVPFRGATWFFKLTGPTTVVGAEKTAYIEFLRTIRPEAAAAGGGSAAPAVAPVAAPADMAGTAVIKAEGPDLKWTAPANWERKPASAMRKGSYSVKGEGGATADLSITAFPGDVGGELANVNRWRGQLQLAPLTADELAGAVVHREQGALKLTIVDLVGGEPGHAQRMLGAIVPVNGATWFIKLVGPDALVAREKPAFLEFLNTLQTP